MKTKKKSSRQSSMRYPWTKWFNGKRKTLSLTKDVDFICATYIMAQQVRNKAAEVSQAVSIDIDGDILLVKIEKVQ